MPKIRFLFSRGAATFIADMAGAVGLMAALVVALHLMPA